MKLIYNSANRSSVSLDFHLLRCGHHLLSCH